MAVQNVYSLDLELDSTQYASISDASQTGLDFGTALTVECWIKLEGTGRQSIIAKGLPTDGGTNYGYILAYRGDQANDPFAFYLNGSTVGGLLTVTANTGGTLEDGRWHHIAVTSTYTTTIIYIDGVDSTTTGGSHVDSGSPANASTFIVGADSNGNYYDGTIDEVRIWNDVRTQAEIVTNMYQNVSASEAGLVGYWQFENDYLDKTSNNNDLTSSGSPTFVSTADGVPFTYYLSSTDNLASLDLESGTSDYTRILDANQTGLDFSTTFTLELWVNSESQPSTNTIRYLIAKDGETENRAYGIFYRDVSGTTYIDANVFDTSVNVDQYRWAVTLTNGVWFHIALTCNVGNASATTFELFVNGKSQGNGTAQASQNISAIKNTPGAFVIGANGTPSYYFDGKIDEVKAFSDVRTSTEIQSDMITKYVSDANLVGEWNFDGDQLDNTANNNDLTISGSPTYSFNGSFDIVDRRSLKLVKASSQFAYVLDNAPLSITADITIEAWVKIATLPSANSANMVIAGKYDLNNQRSYLVLITSSADKLRIQWNSDGASGTTTVWESSSAIITSGELNTWMHLAISLTSATKTGVIYKNGSSVSSALGDDGGATAIWDGTANFTIGTRYSSGTPGEFFDGMIDEVRVWSDVRSSGEISANYQIQLVGNEANLVGYWRLNGNYTDLTSNAHFTYPSGSPGFVHITPLVSGTSISLSPSPSPSVSESRSPSVSESRSPSISESRSESRSPSISESRSPSISESRSPSLSESRSPSLSASLSESASPSFVPSESRSPSLSVSLSPSASPSVGFEEYTRGDYAVLPADDDYLENNYLAQDYTDVATINQVRVAQTATNEYAIHQYKNFAVTPVGHNECFIEWVGQTDLDPATSPVILQIYNYNSSTWETINQCPVTYGQTFADYSKPNRYYVSPGANTDFQLTTSITDLTNYKDPDNNTMTCRIYQLEPSS